MKIHIVTTFHTPSQTEQWFWQIRARNGQICGNSAEGYKSFGHCKRMITKIFGDKFPVVAPKKQEVAGS